MVWRDDTERHRDGEVVAMRELLRPRRIIFLRAPMKPLRNQRLRFVINTSPVSNFSKEASNLAGKGFELNSREAVIARC
jgi:hypothetical protein